MIMESWHLLLILYNYSGSAGLVTKWEQRSLSLAVGGDVRMIRIFDMETENKKYDIPTGADCCTTCLDTDELGLIKFRKTLKNENKHWNNQNVNNCL